MRRSMTRGALALAAAGVLVLAAACGGEEPEKKGGGGEGKGGEGGGQFEGSGDPLVFGTTDSFNSVDPAATYSLPDAFLIANTHENLLTVPPGGSELEPQLAEECDWEDELTYTCTLKDGRQFSDGSPLTAEDVKFSFDRLVGMEHEQGPWTLFRTKNEDEIASGLESVDAPDDKTVTFHLVKPDGIWPFRLAHSGAGIVPSDQYSADEERPDNWIGSGPYKISKWEPSQQIVLEVNENYVGDIEVKNSQVLIQKYQEEPTLKAAIEKGDVHVAYRTLSPSLLNDLEQNGADQGVEVVRGEGTAINYIVLNHNDGPMKQKEVRQAFAMLIDRETIAEDIYDGMVRPLYSMVPEAYEASTQAFADRYGTDPDPAGAAQLLKDAKVKTPVEVELWYQPERYGEVSTDMFAEIKRQVEADGLFSVKLETTSWDTYRDQYPTGAYQAYHLGWFPDVLDADNYVSPFFATGNFFEEGQGYSNERMDELLAEELAETDLEKRLPMFAEIQEIAAEDVPTIPLWQDDMAAAVRTGVAGVTDTFDLMYTFRLWVVDTTGAE